MRNSPALGAELTGRPCPSLPPSSWPGMTNTTFLPTEQAADGEDQEQ
ncbi:hypothetical protein ACI1MP_37130 (plasmid) [Kitasatospora griseola]